MEVEDQKNNSLGIAFPRQEWQSIVLLVFEI